MKASKLAALTALLIGATPVTAVLAHPGHQHNSNLLERALHALETEWGPVLLLVTISIGGVLLMGRKHRE